MIIRSYRHSTPAPQPAPKADPLPEKKLSCLLDILQRDSEQWIEQVDCLISNERDMQVMIADYLRHTGHYTMVDTEYRVPLPELQARGVRPGTQAFPWENQLSIDVVVELDGRFAAIELKYATATVDHAFTLFGEAMRDPDSQIVKNQAASNLTMYNYWKDVRRIETLAHVFSQVDGGVAIIITNNRTYWKAPRTDANYANFSMHEGNTVGRGPMTWPAGVADTITKSHPDFQLTDAYTCRWHDTHITVKAANGDPFRYCIATITNPKNQ